jgi:hypothetical protein
MIKKTFTISILCLLVVTTVTANYASGSSPSILSARVLQGKDKQEEDKKK